MRRIAKLAVVGTMAAGMIGASASAALASGDYAEITATKAVQCVAPQEATGAALLIGLGANVNALNSYSCSGSVNVNND